VAGDKAKRVEQWHVVIAAGPQLFMTGKLKIEGDMMQAANLVTFFRIPRPA
jgi:putative sterol carrier protein